MAASDGQDRSIEAQAAIYSYGNVQRLITVSGRLGAILFSMGPLWIMYLMVDAIAGKNTNFNASVTIAVTLISTVTMSGGAATIYTQRKTVLRLRAREQDLEELVKSSGHKLDLQELDLKEKALEMRQLNRQLLDTEARLTEVTRKLGNDGGH